MVSWWRDIYVAIGMWSLAHLKVFEKEMKIFPQYHNLARSSPPFPSHVESENSHWTFLETNIILDRIYSRHSKEPKLKFKSHYLKKNHKEKLKLHEFITCAGI